MLPSIVVILLLSQVLAVQLALPPNWKVCKKTEADRNSCLLEAINGAVQTLMKGNRKLGVLPLDPFEFGSIHTKGDTNGPVALDLLFHNFVLSNLKILRITSVELNGRNMKMVGEAPGKLYATTPYTIKGKILALPLNGDGDSNFTVYDGVFNYDITFREKPVEKNGKHYLVVEKFIERSTPKKVELYFGNLFNGNKQLGDAMNKVMNENWLLVWNELKGLFEDAISEAFLQVSNRVFSKIPLEELHLL